jgi:CBS domain-containing protein
MNVQTIMTREVKTCRPNDTLDTPTRIMWENDCGCVPVIGDDKRVLGMITDRDICMAAWTQGGHLSEMRVSGAFSKQPHTCNVHATLASAEQIMREYQVRRLPVVDDMGRLVGLLSLNDMARSAADPGGKGETGETVTPNEVVETLAAVGRPRAGTPKEYPTAAGMGLRRA